MKRVICLLVFTSITLTSIAKSPPFDDIKDYFNITRTLLFDGDSYTLSWSSHPSTSYFKEEFLPENQSSEKFKSMLTIDLMIGEFTAQQVLQIKIAELNKMKKSNPIINYHVIENTDRGEYILDFLVSANSADGKSIDILERNVYRYKMYSDGDGRKGVLLFAISKRSYGNDATDFLKKLKTNLNDLVNVVAQYQIPNVRISHE